MKSSCLAIILVVLLMGQVFHFGFFTAVSPARAIGPLAAGIVIAVGTLLVDWGYQASTSSYGQDEPAKADIHYFDIIDESGNGIQVGDYFYVEGTVYFFTGGEPNEEGEWSITVSTSDGKSDEKSGQEDGNKEFSIPFQWRFQAADEGTIKITVTAEVEGHTDRAFWWSIKESEDSDSIEKERTISKPYAWSPYDPYPSKVFHLEKSKAINEIKSLIGHGPGSPALSGRISVDDETVEFSGLGIDEKRAVIKEKRHYVPHILPTKFSFHYALYVYVDLADGSRWEKQLSERKEVECTLNPLDLFDAASKLSRIDWGDVQFEPVQPIEGEQIAFDFAIADPALPPFPPEDITFAWDMGDGTTSEGTSLDHAYVDEDLYLVRVTAKFLGDPIGVEEVYVGVRNAAPTISSLIVPETSNVGETVDFLSDYADPGNSDAIQATWHFGDGTNATGLNVAHTFNDYGHFAYSLTIKDGDDGFDVRFGSLFVRGQQPAASAGGPYTVDETFPLAVNGLGSSDPDGQLTIWMWDFGDGTSGYGNVTTHTYMHEGTYEITLTVVDDNRLTDTDSTTVTVRDVGPTIVEFDVNHNDASNVTIVGSAAIPEPGVILNYAWDLGDGTQVTGEQKVTHVYESPNTYVITLVVDDGEGHSATATKTIIISEPPLSTAELQETLESIQGEIGQMRNLSYILGGLASALIVLLFIVVYFIYLMRRKTEAT